MRAFHIIQYELHLAAVTRSYGNLPVLLQRLRQRLVVLLNEKRPGLHYDRAVFKYEDSRQTRLKLAEHNAVFYEAVVATMVPECEISRPKRSVGSFEAASENSDGSAGMFRADKTGRNEGPNASDAIWSRELWISHLIEYVIRPPDFRMLRAKGEAEFKPV